MIPTLVYCYPTAGKIVIGHYKFLDFIAFILMLMPRLLEKKICERFRGNRFQKKDYPKVPKTVISQNLENIEDIRGAILMILS